jgi:uncharacterized phage-associated protein
MSIANQPVYTYKPSWVANTFLVRAKDDNIHDVDPLKIQKLVYNFHGWHLATTGRPAIGERFEAWPKGPVLSSLYHQFKQFRWNPIGSYATDVDPITGVNKASVVSPADEKFYELFNVVWNRYKNFSGVQLSAITHAPHTPWSRARVAGNQYIDDEDIRSYFLALARGAHE